jgi:hypothetical protein
MIRSLVRFSGIALALGGVLQIIIGFLHPDESKAGALLDPLFPVVHLIAAVSFMALAFGLVGWYLRHADAGGKLGFLAFISAFVGTVLTVGFVIDESFFLVDAAARNPAIKTLNDFFPNATPQIQGYIPVLLSGLLVYLIGWVLVGVATMRVGMLSRWVGLLISVGVFMTFGSLAGVNLIRVIGGVVYGIGLVWLGISLLTTQSETNAAAQPQLAHSR